jgi:hypothetical protein
MNRSTSVRLMRLEAAQPPECERGCHCLIINEGDDQEGLIAAMIASGEAQEDDLFIVNVIVTPRWRE